MSIEHVPQDLLDRSTWGGQASAPTAGAGTDPTNPGPVWETLARIDLPMRFAQTWRIEFARPLLADPQGAGLPPGVPAGPDIDTATVRVQYGIAAGVAQSVIIDYPPAGGGLYVSGAFLEVGVRDARGAGRLALYGAHVVPADRAAASVLWAPPTFTFDFGNLGQGVASAEQYVPAKAYALVMYGTATVNVSYVVTFRNGANTIAIFFVPVGSPRNFPGVMDAIPVPKGATGFFVTQQTVGGGNLSARFHLDMG